MASIKFPIPGTSAAVSVKTFKLQQANLPGLLVVKNLAGTEIVKLQSTIDNGATFFDLGDDNGAVELIGTTRNAVPINVPGHYRLSKGATASSAVEVALSFGVDV